MFKATLLYILPWATGQLSSLVKSGAMIAGGYLVSKGVIDNNSAQQIVGGIVAGVPAMLNFLVSSLTAVAARVADAPGYGVKTPNGDLATNAKDVLRKTS